MCLSFAVAKPRARNSPPKWWARNSSRETGPARIGLSPVPVPALLLPLGAASWSLIGNLRMLSHSMPPQSKLCSVVPMGKRWRRAVPKAADKRRRGRPWGYVHRTLINRQDKPRTRPQIYIPKMTCGYFCCAFYHSTYCINIHNTRFTEYHSTQYLWVFWIAFCDTITVPW